MYCLGTIPRIEPSLITTAQLNRLLPTGIGAPTTTSCARPAVAWAIRSDGPNPGVEQRRLAKEIGAGVARDAQFRVEHDVAAGRLVQDAHDLGGVRRRVGDRGPGRSAGDADKPILVHVRSAQTVVCLCGPRCNNNRSTASLLAVTARQPDECCAGRLTRSQDREYNIR